MYVCTYGCIVSAFGRHTQLHNIHTGICVDLYMLSRTHHNYLWWLRECTVNAGLLLASAVASAGGFGLPVAAVLSISSTACIKLHWCAYYCLSCMRFSRCFVIFLSFLESGMGMAPLDPGCNSMSFATINVSRALTGTRLRSKAKFYLILYIYIYICMWANLLI